MESATASAIASSISALIGAASATVAAISARNSLRSARASEASLRDTRRQRRADDVRRDLANLGAVHDEATELIRALATDLRVDPAAVERCRSGLRRATMVSGLTPAAVADLLRARRPLEAPAVDAVYEQLADLSTALHEELDDLTRSVQERH